MFRVFGRYREANLQKTRLRRGRIKWRHRLFWTASYSSLRSSPIHCLSYSKRYSCENCHQKLNVSFIFDHSFWKMHIKWIKNEITFLRYSLLGFIVHGEGHFVFRIYDKDSGNFFVVDNLNPNIVINNDKILKNQTINHIFFELDD